MDPVTSAWQGGFPIQPSGFGPVFDTDQQQEDWEDWLKWDPAVDHSSPEEGTWNSGSSKNDSPIQDAVLPVGSELFGKANENWAPPLIMGENVLEFGGDGITANDAFPFGNADANFDFQPMMSMEQLPPNIPKIDTSMTEWSLPHTADPQNLDLSAISNYNSQSLPSATTVSSNPPSLHYSPAASQNDTSISSHSPDPPPKKRGGRKRKIDIEREQKEQNGDSQEDGDEPPNKKVTSHNVIEKRYRNNLNDKIVELRNAVPSLRAMKKANVGEDLEDLEGLTAAHKLNKATVMGKATEYIRHLEKRNKTLSDEVAALKARLASVESTISRNRDRQASISQSPPSGTLRPRELSSASVQDSTRFNQQVAQQQYMQHQQQPSYARQPGPPAEAQSHPQYVNARGGGGIMNKVMLGTMAGIMAMEGFQSERSGEDGSYRQLFSIPTGLFKRGIDPSVSSSPVAIARQASLPLLKLVLVVGALLYLLSPLLNFSPRRKQKSRTASLRLPHAPSLASPIEVRRKAWLTAIQTVWVPKHFLLEVVAVTCKMISLSIRQLIGSEAFNTLTGAIKEDEVARIKAWDIAIDAQLAGGDAEVSYYRLLLTLMESGTLPDSPIRLMQKAVHFRVFFWEVANAGYGNMSGFKSFTERVGRHYWETARRQQKGLMYARSQGRPNQTLEEDEIELLPDHLASLVELNCDEVLSDEMIQRAWNLAWNKPSAHRTTANAARDAVVEDHAIRSPLDAVAAWYANMLVDDTLAESLDDRTSTMDTECFVGLAIIIAPPASATLARTLAAKAVLSNTNREANVLAALDALPGFRPSSGEMNVVSHVPASPEVRTALTFAKLFALSTSSASPIAQTRALDTLATLHLPPGSFTLLTAVAAFRLLKSLGMDRPSTKPLDLDTKHSIEDLAANLRVWAGTSAGRRAGLDWEERGQVVDLCLAVAKKIGGWEERDSGYGGSAPTSTEGSPVKERAELLA